MAMDFDLNDDQKAFQESVRSFLADRCTPQQTLSAFGDPDRHDDIWRGLCELGLPGMLVPEEFGGSGMGVLDAAAVAEVIGRFGAPTIIAEHWAATACIAAHASPAAKARLLPALAAGERRATISFAEAEERWTPEEWTLTPSATLSAIRPFVPWAGAPDVVILGLAGGILGLVECTAGTVMAEAANAFDKTRPLATLHFDEAACELLDTGMDDAWRAFEMLSVFIAADACGGASHCLEATVAYAKERIQFGVPIGSFQGIKHQLADLALKVGPSAGLYWYAAHALDIAAPDASLAAAQAKAHIADCYVDAARGAIELHGGIGYTWEFGLHIWLRRSMFCLQYLGSPRKHRARFAALSGW